MDRSSRIRVFLFSNNCILTEGIRSVFGVSGDFELIAACTDLSDVNQRLASGDADIALADVASGATLTMLREIRSSAVGCKVVLWGNDISPEFAFHAMELGIRGILPTDVPLQEFLSALRVVGTGQLWFTKDLMDKVLLTKRCPLTRREGQLITLLSQGLRNKQIAYALGISEGTIKVYLSRVFKKLGVSDRFELALYALKNTVNGQPGGFDAHVGKATSPETHVLSLHSLAMSLSGAVPQEMMPVPLDRNRLPVSR